jgi:hypothetical protein
MSPAPAPVPSLTSPQVQRLLRLRRCHGRVILVLDDQPPGLRTHRHRGHLRVRFRRVRQPAGADVYFACHRYARGGDDGGAGVV